MRTLLLLVAVAALLRKPTPRQKLEKVEKGFNAVLKASPVLEDLVAPMLKEVGVALKGKDDKACEQVLANFPKWQKAMGERQASITDAGDTERTTLLVAVLQNKQDIPASEQMEVVRSADFMGLPVVKFIEGHADGKTPLVNFALQFMDGDKAEPISAPTPEAVPKGLDEIVNLLTKHEENAAKRVAALDKKEAQLKKVFGKYKKDDPQVKFLKRREERKLLKDRALQEQTEKALAGAITDIKNKDPKGLEEAKASLQASMEALQEQSGEFLHFLQLNAPGFSCPYCGAQCIEKCVKGEEHKTYSKCLGQCLTENPQSPP